MRYNPLPAPMEDVSADPPLNLSNLWGANVGIDTSGNFALSSLGLSIRRLDGRFVALDRDEDRVVDVTNLILSGVDPLVYRVPVNELERGDITIVSDDPFSARCILRRRREGRAIALDPDTGDVTEYIPTQDPFLNCFVRAVSLFDFFPGGDQITGDFPIPRIDEIRRSIFRDRGPEERFSMSDWDEDYHFRQALLTSVLLQSAGSNSNIQMLLPLLLSGCGGQGGITQAVTMAILSGAFSPASTASSTTVLQTGTSPTQQGSLPPNFTAILALLPLLRSRFGDDEYRGADRGRRRRSDSGRDDADESERAEAQSSESGRSRRGGRNRGQGEST